MSYNRQFQRRNDRNEMKMKIKTSAKRNDTPLTRKVVAAVTALGFFATPFSAPVALAGKITDSSGHDYTPNNNVYDIYAQKYNSDGKNIAVNQFQKFQLDANKIANMYFRTAKDATEAANLLNFVDTRIDINGTLNAIRNKQIGGNLFFLSPEGMVVGKGGVINTGSLYVMAPSLTQDYMDADQRSYNILKGNFATGAYGNTELEAIKNGSANIRINPSGTISVLGKINATDEVKLYAGKVAVGKNLTKDTIDDTAAGGIEKGAAINTGITDFSQVVKLTAEQQKAAGLDKLTATRNGSGDVVLSARSDAANSLDQAFNDLVNTTGLLKSTDINIPKTITASVENYGTVTAKGDAALTAKATNGYFKEGDETYSSNASGFAQTVAKVDVQGNVTADGAATMTATADNTYVDSGNSVTDQAGSFLSYATPVGANVMLLKNEASVTVGKDAEVTGASVKAEADANLDGTAGVVASGKKYIKKVPSAIPSTGVSYAQVDNKATVQIDGKVKATGKNTTDSDNKKQEALQVQAKATSSVTNSANAIVSAGMLGAGSSSVVAAVAVTNSDNNAQIKVNGTAEAAEGSVKMDAAAEQSLNTSAAAQAPDSTVGAAAVDVMVHDGDASVNVQGTVKGKEDVTLTATNHTAENTHSANNNLGQGKFKAQLMKGVMKAADVQGIVGKVKENPLVKDALSKASKSTDTAASSGSTSSKSLTDALGNTLSVGAAITVADETTTAKVSFGKNSVTEATNGSLSATASNTVYDTLLTANGVTNSFKNKDSDSDTVTIAVGTVFGGMKNSASVTVEDGTKDKKAQLKAGTDLSLTTTSRMDYNRVTEIKKGLDESIAAVKSAAADMKNWEEMGQLPELKELYDELVTLEETFEGISKTFYTNYLKHAPDGTNLTADGTINEVTNLAATSWNLYNQFMELQNKAMTLYQDIQAQDPLRAVKEEVQTKITNLLTSPMDVVSASMEYLSPNNYANIAATASAKGGEDTAAATAASVTVSDFNFDSQVQVGKNAQLTAGDTLNLKADEAIKDVTMTGKSKFWKNDAATGKSDGVGLGGSFNYQDFDNNTLVQVGKGASLTAGDMALKSSSNVFHTGVMLSAGKADGSAINGMMALTSSDSSNKVLVDKDALLKAVKDDAKNHKGSIAITGYNNTNVNNAILSLAAGSGAAAAGMAAAVNNIDVTNRAAVENLSPGDDDDDKGQIEAASLDVNAETTGLLNAVSVAGGVTSAGTEPEKGKTETGGMSSVGNLFGKVTNPVGTVTSAVGTVSNKVKDAITWVNTGGKSQGGTKTPVPTKSDTAPSFSLAGAGSLSLNLVDDTTQAVVDGATVKLNNDGAMNVGARDTAYVGAYSGGAAISLRKGKSNKESTNVAFSGAVGMNSIDNTIEAAVKNSTITGVKNLDIEALSGGTSVAAGTALALTKSSQPGNNFAGGASASVNLIDKNVKALSENNTVTGKAATEKAKVDVTAYESDLQVTGGVNADVAIGGGNAAGGSLTIANIKNNLEAGIHGGTYTNIGDAKVQGLLATKQISAAISAGVAVGGGDKNTDNAFTGAMLYNGLHNTVSANISNTANITADSIAVKAHDTTSGSDEAKAYQDKLGNYKDKETMLQNAGIDTDGSSYYKTSDSSNGLDMAGETVDFDGNKGSLSVGAAFVVTGSKDNAAGAAVNVANLDNNFTAKIDGSALTADSITAQAEADSLAVNVTAGVAAGAKDFGGMGSVTWQDQNNAIQAQVTDSSLTADKLNVNASNNTQAVNVAGSVAYGKTAGIGAALAYNGLDNHIGAYLAGGSVTAKTPAAGVSVDVEGKNTGKIYGLGAAVAASQKTAVNGTVVVNHGGSDTEAAIGEVRAEGGTNTAKATAVSSAKAVTVKAESDDVRVAAAGSVSGSGKVALGGAVAYNDVGGASTSTAKASQKTRAAMTKTTLTNVTGGTASVEAVDGSKMTTAAFGVGGAGKVAVQGAAATALVNKAVTAEVQDFTVDKDADKGATLSVKADSQSTISSLAVVGAGGGDFAGGAGVSVNRINQDTKASMSGSTVKDKHTTVQAAGNSAITSVGIGAAVAGKAALAGNIAVNQIGNDVKAAVTGSTLTSSGNIGVLADGKETLTNFAGTVSGAAGNAGLGMGVSYNAITGDTESTVAGSTLEAKGQENETVGDKQKGVAVTAAGTHNLQSVALTAGLAGSDNVAVGAAGTVTVNNIGGTTRAAVTDTDINKNLDNSTADDVAVKAQDVTKSESHVGSLAVGIGADGGAGVSAASDTLILSRKTAAELSGTKPKRATTVNGRNISVTADQQSTVVTNADGVAGAGGVYGAGAVAATAAATKLDGSVSATMKNITSKNHGLEISAKHDHKTTLVSASAALSAAMVSGAVGAGVGVVNDDFTTNAELMDSDVKADKAEGQIGSGSVKVAADSSTSVTTVVAGVAGSMGAAAATISVNNLNSQTSAVVKDSLVSAEQDFTVDAHNKVNTKFNAATIGAGGAAIATGVGVNTIGTSTLAKVEGSTVNAKTADIKAREELDVDQNIVGATVGGMGLNANVMVTSIGTKLADTYGSSADKGASFDTAAVLQKANTALDSQQTATTDDTTASSKVVKDTLHNTDTGVESKDASGVSASSGKSDAKGTQAAVTDSAITTEDTLALSANRQTDAKITAAAASVSGSFGLSATVAVLDAKKDAGVSISGSTLQAENVLSAEANQSGKTSIDAYQANIAGVAAVSAAYAQSSSSGATKVETVDSTLTSDSKDITMKAADASQTASSVYGATAGLVTAGALVSKADNTSDTNLAIKGSTLNMAQGTADLQADKANVVTAKTYGGSFGLVGANGVVALASDEGSSKILVSQSGSGKNSTFAGQTVNLQATTRPAVTAETGSLSVALLGSASASAATASAKGGASVQADDGTTFDVDKAEIAASAESQNGENNSEAKVKGFAAAGRGTAVVNAAKANMDIDTDVTLGKVSFKKDKGTALSVTSANTTQTAADARGITVGGLFASGTNLAYTGSGTEKDANTSTITLTGDKTQLRSLSVNASGTTHNVTTADGSGGGMVSGDLAGAVDNKTYTNSKVTLKGSWDVAGDVDIQSAQTDHMDLNADATKAAVVGASATKADNTANGAADVVLTGSQVTSGGTLTAKADSKADFGQNKAYAVEGSGYGGVAVQGAKLNNTVSRTSTVDVSNASLTSSGSQTLAAEAGGKINAAGYIKAAGAGAATWVDVDNNLTSRNTITTDGKTSLRTDAADSDITLAAADDWDVTAKGVADTQGGAVGGASSDVKNTLQRTNKVDVQGKVYSLGDVNLYAGKDANGAMDNLDLNVESEAYNKTALSVAVPKFKDTLTQANQVIVGKDAEIAGVRHVNAYADEAGKYLREQSVKYTWYHSDANENFTSTSVGKKSDSINDKTDNYVQIDGKVTAGAQNKQKIVIGGSGQTVILDKDELAAVKAVKGQENAVQRPTIDASSGIDTSKIRYARIDYANALMTRYYELAKLISQYSDSKDLTALKGYQDEQTRIYNELNDLGLLSEVTGPDNKTYLVPVQGLTVDTIVLPDIVASGGNITVEAGSLKGAGTLKAQGSPEVTVENHTNLYMKVGDVKAVNPGGEIHYNGQSLAKDAAAVIKSGNQDKAAAVNLMVSTDAATSAGGTVTIKSDYGTAAIKAKIDEVDADNNPTGKKVDAELVPKADIEINGNVEAENGVVTVEDKNYNILLQGEGSRTAEVNGKEIHLTAGKSISQGFTQGIVNIGGNPEELYKDKYFNSEVNEFNNAYGYENTSRVHREDRTHDDVLNGSGSRIAGDNIYINASDINVNGLIQSGYGKYEVTIDSGVTPKVQRLQHTWRLLGGRDLSDNVVTTGTYYLVQKGGKVLQTDGTYKYQPDVYYNPSTQKLVIPDIDAHGGKIYLNGRISSTGNGKIVALDGAYDISVTNNTNTALQVGKLISNKSDGLISIADSAKNQVTEYTRGSTVVKDLTKWDKTTGDWKVLSKSGASSVYNPQQNLRYNWTSGQKVTTKKHYKHDHKAGLWGAVTTLNETELAKYEQEITPQDMGHNTFTNDNGVYIDTSSLTNKDKQYVFVYDNVVLNNDRTQPVVTKRWKTGFLGWFHWERTEWDTNTGTAQQYVGSVKADHGINIGFLGNQNGNSAINVTSKSGVTLAGKIQSSQSGTGSTIAITSQEGAINQNGGLLKGDNVKLSAKNGLTNIAVESLGDTVQLDAVNTGSGNMNITVDGAYGKAGHVNLVQAKNANGDVSLTVLGNLTQSGTAAAVEGNRIDLVSRQGSIGTDAAALKVKTPDIADDALNPLSSSVNVTAKSNIHVAEDSDLRVGTIKSTEGDVKLTATGSIIDALPSGDTIDRGNTAALVQGWKDLGLIEGDGQYKQKQAADVAEYKAGVQSEMEQYLKLKTAYENNEKAAKNDANYQALKERYGDYTSADDYLAGSETAKNHLAELQKAGAGWSENELLYAISDAIVNKQQGSTDTELKQANISGRNITLQAKNVGSDKAAEDVLVKDITTDARLDDLKKVVNANVSDVGYTANDKGEKVFRIYGKVPVGIEAKGELNVQSDGNIYVAGRTSGENKDTVLKLGKVTTNTGDIRVLGKAGVTNSLTDGSVNLKGKDLILEGGSADIGTVDKKIAVDLTGSLSALTDGSMYMSSVGTNNLQLTGLYAGKDMVLDSKKDIIMSPSASEQAYLNAGRLLDLKAEGGIGAKDSAIRILGNGAAVNAEAKNGDIYLAGKNKAGETEGLLLLGSLKTVPGHTVSVTSETSLSLGQDDEASPIDSQVTADTVNLSSDRDIDLVKGSLKAAKAMGLKAGGHISQTAAHNIAAPTASLDAQSGIDLNSGAELDNNKVFNDFQTVSVKNGSDQSDVTLGNGGSKDLTVSFLNNTQAKNVAVRNYKNGAGNNMTVNGPLTATEGISLVNDEGDLKTTGVLTVGSGRLHEDAVGAVENEDILTGEKIVMNSTAGILNKKSLISDNQVELTAVNDIVNQGIVQAGTYVNMTSNTGSITNAGSVEAKNGGVTMNAKTDLHNEDTVKAAQDVSLQSGTSMTNGGAVTANQDITMNAGTTLTNSDLAATTGKVDLTSAEAMQNKGSVTAGTTVGMTSTNDSITNEGAVEAKGTDVTMNAHTDLHNADTVKAAQDVSLTSGQAMANDKAVTAVRDITMNAGTTLNNGGDLTSTNGAISLTAQKGLQQSGNAMAGSSITMENQQDGDLVVTGDVQSGTATIIKNNNGAITVGTQDKKGSVTAGTTASLKTANGPVTVYGDVEGKKGAIVKTGQTGNIDIEGSLKASESGDAEALAKDGSIKVNGQVEAANGNAKIQTEKGTVSVAGAMTASDDVMAQSHDGDVTVDGTMTAGHDLIAKSSKGDVLVKGQMDAGNDATAQSDNGNVTVEGQMKANNNLLAQSTNGDATIKGGLISGKATKASAANGSVHIDGDVQSGTSAEITAQDGNVGITGQVTGNTSVLAQAANGDVTIGGSVTGGTSVTAQATEGNVSIDGSVESKTGDTVLSATDSRKLDEKGNVSVKGSLKAAADALLKAENGDIKVGGQATAGKNLRAAVSGSGNIVFAGTAEAADNLTAETQQGDITFQGSVQSGQDLTAKTAEKGNITFQGNAQSGQDLIAGTAEEGSITFDGAVSAGRDLVADAEKTGSITLRRDAAADRNVDFHTNDGNILFAGSDAGKTEDIHLTAEQGDVNIQVTGTGAIKDEHTASNGDRGFVNATNGNVKIKHEGTGDVDLYGLYAKKDAAVELKNGSLYLDNIDGNLVAMFVRNPSKTMDVRHVTAGTEIAVSGSDLGVDDIMQREGSDGVLTITPNGARDDMPIENLRIGDIKSTGGIRFNHLWLRNGSVKVSKGKFLIDKLYVLDKATFSNGVMTTNVFGTAPVYDKAVTSAYWVNTRLNRPQDALQNWLSSAPDAGRWMFLRFYGQGDTQLSNGNLLDLADHYHVYRERYTETDWMRMLLDSDRYAFYRTYYHPALSYHDRYDLVDPSAYIFAGTKNMTPAVTVESEA
ncbi:MAG: leukotoxin LktA family filamentous adhesin [Mitsuokella sp.]|uniref:leukotoxin LktA family filamentous adhesin n=1 Tax=Mitsuokella sp. TaxID=2049034 RepID=UPI003EFDC470